MTELGSEGLVEEVRTYLTANLAGHLATVDARYASAVSLQDMTEWRLDDPLYGRLPDKLPLGWIVAARTAIDQWQAGFDYMGTALVIWVLIRDQDSENLRRRIYRTSQAIWECLKTGHFDGSVTWQILDAPEMDFSEILTGPRGILLSDMRLRVQMYTREAP